MIGIYSNGYVEVTASRLGFDLVKPYWFTVLKDLKLMEGDLFYKTFKYKRECKKIDFLEDKALIRGLIEEGIMPNDYFEILKIGF